MARSSLRRPENAPGEFFVDTTCIDCDTCRWMAPATFDRVGEMARVHSQPEDEEERRRASMALLSCPTASIGTEGKARLEEARAALPDRLDEGVFHCGYHAEASFGAASYLLVRPEGNVLVDSPRFAGPLVERLEQLGGVRTLFLTHQDDVADHERYRAHFGCERVLHAADARGALRKLETLLEGEEPIELAPDLVAIPTPGHTRGSMCLLANGRHLFTGDHLAWSEPRGHLYAFRSACWYDWRTQIGSMERLARHDFECVLPGHGRRAHLLPPEMRAQMQQAIAWMRSVA